MTTPDPNQPAITAAVQRCLDAYHHELAIPRPKDGTDHSSKTYARKAYRNAMPFLSSPANIDAFIACVAHGLLINAIRGDDASKLLYAAQVAIASRRLQQQKQPNHPQSDARPTPTPLLQNHANTDPGHAPNTNPNPPHPGLTAL